MLHIRIINYFYLKTYIDEVCVLVSMKGLFFLGADRVAVYLLFGSLGAV